MSKKLDALDLQVIQELAKRSQTVRDLMFEKKKALIDIEQSRNINFKTFDPAPKPQGDIRINKRHQKETMSNTTKETILERVKGNYNKQIKDALIEKAIEIDREHIYPLVENFDSQELAILIEEGREAFEEKIEQKEIDLTDTLKLDMDSLDERYAQYPILLDFENNREDIDKAPSPDDDFE